MYELGDVVPGFTTSGGSEVLESLQGCVALRRRFQ